MTNKIDIPPVLLALACQLLAFALFFFGLIPLQSSLGFTLDLIPKLFLQGVLAAFFTLLLRQSYWWVIIQLGFPLALFLALQMDSPIWVYPLVLLVLAMIFWNVVFNQVPLYLSNNKTAQKLATLLPKTKPARFVDLGSGLANTLRDLAIARPTAHFYGFETAPGPFLLSKLITTLKGQGNVHLQFKNIWKVPLGEYDVVYCFLSPVPMLRLYEKAKAEMKSGSLFISNSFTVPGVKPDRTVTVGDSRKTKLLIWKM